jgi:TonB family protein
MKPTAIVLSFLIALCHSIAGQNEIVLTAAHLPAYPPLAHFARVQGTVELTFTLPANQGEPTNVEIVSGHPLLKGYALENVKTWKFENPYAVERKYNTTFDFRFSEQEFAGRGRVSVTFESFHHVIVLSDPPETPVNY